MSNVIKLTDEQIREYVERIKQNEVLYKLFSRLFSLYGAPKWLLEVRPFQDPEVLIEEWEKLVAEYDELDITEAVNRLFRYRKTSSFPTAAHILAELPEDTPKKKTPEEDKTSYQPPAALVPFIRKAKVFGVACRMFISDDDDINREGENITKKLPIKLALTIKDRTEDALEDWARANPYENELYAQTIEKVACCYKDGGFDVIRRKIRDNIGKEDGEYYTREQYRKEVERWK